MMTSLFPGGTALQTLGLALLVGGMLALGAFTAPVLFKQFARPEAGEAMTLIFRRYDTVLLVGLGLILGGEILRVLGVGAVLQSAAISLTPLALVRYGVLAVLTGLLLFSVFKVNPQMQAMQEAGKQAGGVYSSSADYEKFTAAHHLSEKLYKIELMAAVLLLLLTPFVPRLPR